MNERVYFYLFLAILIHGKGNVYTLLAEYPETNPYGDLGPDAVIKLKV